MLLFGTKKRNSFVASMLLMATFITLAVNLLLADRTLADSASPLDVMESLELTEDTTPFTNPERGWYKIYKTHSSFSGLNNLRSNGIGVILLCADLKDFKTSPLSEAKLSEIRNAFSKIRQAGLSVVFRAAYDFDGVKAPEPRELSIIIGHISQLSSIFMANEDILYCVQAGFLGSWGEWHSSYYGGTPSLEARKAVLSALMNAVPRSRAILVRRPMFIRDMFDNQTISASTAFSGSDLARTGYHDDALLSTQDENGTYVAPGYSRQAELACCNNLTAYTPFVGESDMLTSYSDPQNAVYELNLLHAQSINSSYYGPVLSKWKSTSYGGMSTYDYISSRLGYRFVISDAHITAKAYKGGVLRLNFNVSNTGFGNMLTSRGYEIILSNGSKAYVARISDDLRNWTKESGVMNKDLYISIPSGIASGEWNVYINFPGPYANLRNNPLYSIRLANAGVWDASTGYNLIKSGLVIEDANASDSVSRFTQISRNEAEALMSSVKSNIPAAEAQASQPPAAPSPTPNLTEVNEPNPETPVPQPFEPTPVPQAFEPNPAPQSFETTPAPGGFASEPSAFAPPAAEQTATVPDSSFAAPAQNTVQLSAAAGSGTLLMTITNDANDVYFKVSGSGLDTKSQFFIDIDDNSNTGYRYKWAQSGFEYLIEDDILYRYAGVNNKWKWERVQGVTVQKDNSGIFAILPIKAVNTAVGSAIKIGFISNDDKSLVYPLLDAGPVRYLITQG